MQLAQVVEQQNFKSGGHGFDPRAAFMKTQFELINLQEDFISEKDSHFVEIMTFDDHKNPVIRFVAADKVSFMVKIRDVKLFVKNVLKCLENGKGKSSLKRSIQIQEKVKTLPGKGRKGVAKKVKKS